MSSAGRGRETSDLQRSVGGLLLAVGALVVLFRSQDAPHWTEFERTLMIGLPTLLLLVLALGPRSRSEVTGPPARAAPWRSVLLVTGLLLSPAALAQLLEWLGVDTGKWSVQVAIALATALVSIAGARRARTPYGFFVAGIALLIAWLILWSKIIHHPSPSDYRWFLLSGGTLLLLAAGALGASALSGAGELAVAGGLAGVIAGSLGVFVSSVLAPLSLVGSVTSSSSSSSSGRSGATVTEETSEPLFGGHSALHSSAQHLGWDIYLLVLSLLLVWVGSRIPARGLGYVGGIGLLLFTFSVGAQLSRLDEGHTPGHSLLGWPVVLVALGLLALLGPLVSERLASRRR